MKIAGVDKDLVREMLDIEVDDEAWREFVSRRNGALLGVDFARDPAMRDRYVWEAGKEFAMADFDDLSLYFAGTFTPRDPTLRSVILVGDRFLMEADGRLGTANQILVEIGHRDDAERIAGEIEALPFPIKIDVKTQQDALDRAIADLDTMLRYALLVMVVVIVVILVGLANATSMAVRERVTEVGLLRTLGFSRPRIVGLVSGESFLLALLGGAVGCAAAWLLVSLGGARLTSGGFSFPVTLSVILVLGAAVGSAAVGILGGLPAGVLVSRRPIVEALRSVDG